MYDYVDGKVDWMAYGLPVEGDEGPFVGAMVGPTVTVDVADTVGLVRALLGEADEETAIVTYGPDLAVGEVDENLLDGCEDDRPVLDVMGPVPSTVRPSATVSSLAGASRRVVVSTSDGRLLGQAVVDADDHADHDHADHDHDHDHDNHDHDNHDNHDNHDHAQSDVDRMERELTEVMEAVAEHFGDREPDDEELRRYLRDRLVSQGRSTEEADQFMAEIDQQGDG